MIVKLVPHFVYNDDGNFHEVNKMHEKVLADLWYNLTSNY